MPANLSNIPTSDCSPDSRISSAAITVMWAGVESSDSSVRAAVTITSTPSESLFWAKVVVGPIMRSRMRTAAARLKYETLCINLFIQNSFCKLVQALDFAGTEKEWGYIGGHIHIHPLYVRERNTHYICVLSELNRLLTYGYSVCTFLQQDLQWYTHTSTSDYSGTPAPDFHGFPLFIP